MCLILWGLCTSSFLHKTENIAYITNESNSQIEKMNLETEGVNFREFVTEANGHMISGGGQCSNPAQCRTLNEMLYIAYYRSKALKDELNIERIFITSVETKMDISGITKVLITIPELLGPNNTDKDGAPIFKICIPTDRNKSSYLDYKCPIMDCVNTLQEALLCEDDPSVPLVLPFKK